MAEKKDKSISESYKELEGMVVASSAQAAAANRALAERNQRHNEMAAKLDAFKNRVMEGNNKSRRIAVDLGGGTIAQVSTELINWGVRALGRWSGTGLLANNADILQGIPHFILGLGIYVIEMATRKETEKNPLPSASREVISEASKLFAQLGFSNLVRAIRMRWSDSKDLQLSHAALQAEKASLLNQLQALQGKKP